MIILFLCLILTGCTFESPDESNDSKGERMYSNIPLYYADFGSIYSLDDISDYIGEHVKYKKDIGKDHAQSPQETLTLGTGDCEDLALLFINIAYVTLDIKCDLIRVNTRKIVEGGRTTHATVLTPDGIIIEPLSGRVVNYTIRYIYFFDDIFNKE